MNVEEFKFILQEGESYFTEFIFDSFYTIIFRRKFEGVNLLLNIIKKYPGKRTPFFSRELNTSSKNIERWIKKLRDKGIIEFKGSSKSGGYCYIERGKKR